jgi:hypothetical protein
MSISLTDFYFLNPEIDSNCTNLLLGSAYCVAPVGDISLYANYTKGSTADVSCLDASAPTSCFMDIDSFPTAALLANNITFPKYNRTSTTRPSIATQTPFPTPSGTVSGCSVYLNYQRINSTIPNAAKLVNSCSYVARSYDVLVSDLISWNPSLNSNVTLCELQSGYSYCVTKSSSTTSGEMQFICPYYFCLSRRLI